MYCTYKVRKNLFSIKSGYHIVLMSVVTLYSRLFTTRNGRSYNAFLPQMVCSKRKPQIDGLFLNERKGLGKIPFN